ncbi:MAG TPA: SIR2 family protein, partial [Terriglobales bacterium]
LVKRIKNRIAAAEYEEAASDLLEQLQARRFQDLLAQKFGAEVSEIIRTRRLDGAIAELPKFPSGPIVTTNFDRVLEAVFEKAGKPITAFWHDQASKGSEALQQGRPFLLKLHGDWSDQDTRVLTLEEYRENYGNVRGNRYSISFDRPLPMLLFLLLSSRCCLFLGCSLRNDGTIHLLRAISRRIPDMVHYAIVERPEGKEEFDHRSAELSAQGIRPIWYPYQRHDLIRPILRYFALRAGQRRPDAAANGQANAQLKKAVPNSIPDPGNITVGRKDELHLLLDMLRGARLISITGAGGCGKSRLAIELANKVKGRFPDGVWFIPLADLDKKADHERLLPTRIGRIIGVPEKAGRPPNEALAEHLSLGTHLLVLDNCEHLLASCRDTIAYLLRECPKLVVVATSQLVLKLPMERLMPIAPLSTPPPGDIGFDDIQKSHAVQLFVERARQHWPEYQLDAKNAPEVAELCRTLDGIPLAIEIAAARIAVKSVKDMNDESRNLLAAVGSVDSGHALRWKTLTAALQWSYGLLDSQEQSLMASLS